MAFGYLVVGASRPFVPGEEARNTYHRVDRRPLFRRPLRTFGTYWGLLGPIWGLLGSIGVLRYRSEIKRKTPWPNVGHQQMMVRVKRKPWNLQSPNS